MKFTIGFSVMCEQRKLFFKNKDILVHLHSPKLILGNGPVVQLVRMPPCHGGGRGFESRPVRLKPSETIDFRGFFVLIKSQSHQLFRVIF